MTTAETGVESLLTLPDTEIAVAANDLVAEVAPAFIYNHSVRSYVFARALSTAHGMKADTDYDDEVLFLSCILHDLGATDYANGDQRFEVDGADAAAAFLRRLDVDEARIKTVWNTITLHTSLGLAHRFGPTEAIAQIGIGGDIVGYERELLPAGLAELAHLKWPRYDLGYALSDAVAEQVESNPAKGGPLTFPGQLHQLVYPSAPRATWFDVIDASGWGDRRRTGGPSASQPEELIELFVKYCAAGDVDSLLALYEPVALYVAAPGAGSAGSEAIRAALAALIDSGRRVDLTPRRVQVVDDIAVISNTARVTTPDGVLETVTTEIARRQRDGRWLYVFDDPFFAA